MKPEAVMWFLLACSVDTTLVALDPRPAQSPGDSVPAADEGASDDRESSQDRPREEPDSPDAEPDDTGDPSEPGSAPERCEAFGAPAVVGRLPTELDEVSGLVASRSQPGVLWAVEDSGNDAVVYALDIDGSVLARVRLDVPNQDWEELSLAPCGEHDCLQVADVGDNALARDSVQLYRFAEPQLPSGDLWVDPAAEEIVYADGAHNVEAVVVDTRGRTTLFSKREDGFSEVIQSVGGVYSTVASFAVARDGDSSWESKLTGASLDLDRGELYLRTYAHLARAEVGEGSFAELARLEWEEVQVETQPQVEVVAFDGALRGLWEVSEGEGAPLMFTACAD